MMLGGIYGGDMVNAFMQMIPKREHLQIAKRGVSSGSALFAILSTILVIGCHI